MNVVLFDMIWALTAIAVYAGFGLLCFDSTSAEYASSALQEAAAKQHEVTCRLIGPSPRSWFRSRRRHGRWIQAVAKPWAKAWLVFQAGHFKKEKAFALPKPAAPAGVPPGPGGPKGR